MMFDKIRRKSEYKPYEYWKKRGEKYEKNYVETDDRIRQETELIKYFDNLSFESILEFGCGFGRMTKLVAKKFSVKKYLAFDLSPHQVSNAKRNCKNLDFIDFRINTIEDIILEDKFDLVFGTMVFLHIPPTNIKSAIKKLTLATKRNFVHLDWYPLEKPKKIADHNFIHPYPEIYKQIDESKLKIVRIDDNNCIFNLDFN